MAPRITVDGNRVVIDDSTYEVRPAGTNRYSIFDEVGRTLGNFWVRAKAIVPDDYGVEDAHSLVDIARAWRNANDGSLNAGPPPSRMICEIVTLASAEPDAIAKERAHRTWLKTQSGLKSAICTVDAASGKALSIRVWTSAAKRDACLALTPPPEAAPPDATSTETLALVDDP